MLFSRYFAYGSNLNPQQMQQRCPQSRVGPRARLHAHALAFGGHSRNWGGATATVIPSTESVPGVLYDISPSDLEQLDGFEGHPEEYRRQVLSVEVMGGGVEQAWVYILPLDGPALPPAPPYLEVLRKSYEYWGFDVEALMRAARGAHR